GAAAVPRAIGDMLLQLTDGRLDTLSERQQLRAELGNAIACRVAGHQLASDARLELAQPAVDRRLIDAQGLAGRDRAAMPCNSEKMSEVVPIEHAALCDFAARAGNHAAAAPAQRRLPLEGFAPTTRSARESPNAHDHRPGRCTGVSQRTGTDRPAQSRQAQSGPAGGRG